MDALQAFAARRQTMRQSTQTHAKSQFELVQRSLDLYARGLSQAKPEEPGNAATVRMSLASYNFNTIYIASQAAFEAFYLQSLSMLRIVYENWLAFHYVQVSPGSARLWLEAGRKPPKPEEMRARVATALDLTREYLNTMYSILSKFAHTDPAVILSHYREVGGQPHIFVGIEFDHEAFLSCCYGIAVSTGLMLDAITPWIASEAWQREADQAATDAIEFIRWHDTRPQPGAA